MDNPDEILETFELRKEGLINEEEMSRMLEEHLKGRVHVKKGEVDSQILITSYLNNPPATFISLP